MLLHLCQVFKAAEQSGLVPKMIPPVPLQKFFEDESAQLGPANTDALFRRDDDPDAKYAHCPFLFNVVVPMKTRTHGTRKRHSTWPKC